MIFLSHASVDKEFANRLKLDLERLGHLTWMDTWNIKVGDSIVREIDRGLSDADYVVLIISPTAVDSGWVDREWHSVFWKEIQESRTILLPILKEDCKIPALLVDKKYADCRNEKYATGLVELMAAISPSIKERQSPIQIVPQKRMHDEQIYELLTKVQSRLIPLSSAIVQALNIARINSDSEFETFCTREMTGLVNQHQSYTELSVASRLWYRQINVYITPYPINMQYVGWGQSASSVFEYLRADKDSFQYKMLLSYSVSDIEEKARACSTSQKTQILSFTVSSKQIRPDVDADITFHAYAPVDTYASVLDSIRQELTRRLLGFLPPPATLDS